MVWLQGDYERKILSPIANEKISHFLFKDYEFYPTVKKVSLFIWLFHWQRICRKDIQHVTLS